MTNCGLIFLHPRPWQEGSYELRSVLPSIHPSVCLFVLFSSSSLGTGSLAFSETSYGVGDPYRDRGDSPFFFFGGGIPFWQEWPKMVKKWPKIKVFRLFRKICSLVLTGNGVGWKSVWPFSIQQKHEWHEWARQDVLMGFLQKLSFGSNGPFWA